jgi:hypothetical protein
VQLESFVEQHVRNPKVSLLHFVESVMQLNETFKSERKITSTIESSREAATYGSPGQAQRRPGFGCPE